MPVWIKFMVRDILDLRSNKWIPRREEVKAKRINEIHAEAEHKLGLHPGMMQMRNGQAANVTMQICLVATCQCRRHDARNAQNVNWVSRRHARATSDWGLYGRVGG